MSDPLLEAAIKRRFGAAARIENFEVATLGGSSRTLLFDLVDGAARRRLVSRQESYQAADSPFLRFCAFVPFRFSISVALPSKSERAALRFVTSSGSRERLSALVAE